MRTPAGVLRRLLAGVARPGGGPPRPGRAPAPGTWGRVDAGGTVHLHLPVPELGQGAHTVLAQLVLEELRVDPARLVIHPPDTDRGFPVAWMTAVGGSTADSLDVPARRAGAALYRALAGGPGRRGRPRLRPRAEQRVVGTALPRVDLPAKVTGGAVFTSDVRLPGMLYGAVRHPPRPGAVLAEVQGLAEARAVPGVAVVLADPRTGLLAAAAERRSQAEAALAALRPRWRGGATGGDADVRAAVTVSPPRGHVVQERGDVPGTLARARHRVSAEYRTAMTAPAPPEPPVAVADVTPDRVTVHASTQNPGMVRSEVARALGRRRGAVRVVVPYVGGSFGRKHGHLGDPAADAARLSAAAGRPVHLAWTRDQELQAGPKRAPTHHLLDAALGEDRRIAALQHRTAAGDASASWPLTRRVARLSDLDLMAVFGAHLLYERVPALRTTVQRVPLTVPLTGMRSLGTAANTFAVESFVDELARAADADPLEFRLRHLGRDDTGRRLRRALEAAAAAADWGAPDAAGRARGVACCAYGRTVVAHVVETAVGPVDPLHPELGRRPQPHRVTAAVEGRQVNPDIARAQSEGGVVMGLSWALVEAVHLDGGRVVTDDAGRYPVLSAGRTPRIDTVLLDGPRWAGGANEAVTAPVAAALANATAALTGHRLRELPLRLPPGG